MEFNERKLKDAYELGLQRYTYYRTQSLKERGLEVNPSIREQINNGYISCIDTLILYLRTVFPNGFTHSEGSITLDYQKMLESVGSNVGLFLRNPSIDGTIKAFQEPSALTTFTNGILVEASNLEKIKKLPRKYRTKHLNSLLEGLNIEEVRDLFASLGVLGENNMFDLVIKEYKMRVRDRADFVENTILKLLSTGSEEDLARAYLFDHFMGANFDFDKFEKDKKRTK